MFSPVSTKRNNLSTASTSTCAPPTSRSYTSVFQRLGAHGRVRRLVGRERVVQQVQRRRLGTRLQLYTSKCNATTNSGACHTFWPALYQDIRCANVILEGIEKYNTPIPRHAPARFRSVSARSFLRAYLHYCVLKELRRMPLRGLHGRPQQPAEIRTRERPLDRRKDMQRLRRRLFPRPGAEPDGSVRPRGEGYLPCIEQSHGALDRRHAALQRLDAQRR